MQTWVLVGTGTLRTTDKDHPGPFTKEIVVPFNVSDDRTQLSLPTLDITVGPIKTPVGDDFGTITLKDGTSPGTGSFVPAGASAGMLTMSLTLHLANSVGGGLFDSDIPFTGTQSLTTESVSSQDGVVSVMGSRLDPSTQAMTVVGATKISGGIFGGKDCSLTLAGRLWAAPPGPVLGFYAPNDGVDGHGHMEFFSIDQSGNFSVPLVFNDLKSTWSAIVPLGGSSLLFYAPNDGDNGAGLGEVDILASRVKSNTDWRSSWSIIRLVPIVPVARGPQPLLLFYAPHDGQGGAGSVEFDRLGADQSITRASSQGTYDLLRSSWTKIVACDGTRYDPRLGRTVSGGLILFYAPNDGVNGAGLGEFYIVDGNGQMSMLASYNEWRNSWDIIELFPNSTSEGLLLLYDSHGGIPGCGYAEIHRIFAGGEISTLFTESDWRSTWTMIRMFRMGPSSDTGHALEGMGLFLYAPHDGAMIQTGFMAADAPSIPASTHVRAGVQRAADAPTTSQRHLGGGDLVNLRMGYGELYRFNNQGVPILLNKFNPMRSSWTDIVSLYL
jgi:hypothetical protein